MFSQKKQNILVQVSAMYYTSNMVALTLTRVHNIHNRFQVNGIVCEVVYIVSGV